MSKAAKESIYKNIIILAVLIGLYSPIKDFLINSAIFSDAALAGNVLVATSIIAVTACFGNFAFQCDDDVENNTYKMILAHVLTGLFLLIIGISLIFVDLTLSIIVGDFIVLDLTLLMLYASCVLYEFWDIAKNIG